MNSISRLLGFTLLALAAGCHTPQPVHDWSTYEGLGAEHFQKEEIEFPSVPDPAEPVNRAFWNFNEGLLTHLGAPLGNGYRTFVGARVREGIGNFFTNLLFPGRVLNNLLQGKWGASWTETKRFGVNTTAGVLGLRDPATRWGMPIQKEDFGQTFAKWGWKESTYFVAPFFGPSTVRDTVGLPANWAVDPAFYYPPSAQVRGFNRLSDEVQGLVHFMQTQYDAYELARLLYVLNRQIDVDDYSFKSEGGGATETLGSVFLKPRDPRFTDSAETYTVRHPGTNRDLAYSVWLHPDAEAVVYMLPGLGGHRLGSSAAALAEAIHSNGNTAITISSALHSEFIASGLTAELPGFLPSDAHDVHVALGAIDADLRARFPEQPSERRLGGISMGAITTLFIAAAESEPGNQLMDFDLYMAINAPVNLEYGVRRLDAFYNAPMVHPPEERDEAIAGIFRKTLDLAQGELTPGDAGLPYTRNEAEFLIGLSFRNTIRDLIFQTQLANDRGVIKAELKENRRTDAYREITQFSFMEYVYALALPYYAEQRSDITLDEAGARRLFELCDLRSIGSALAENPKVRFVSNRNDFLLRSEDIDWITRLLGEERVLFFERGGHLGNLGRDDIREAIRNLGQNVIDS